VNIWICASAALLAACGGQTAGTAADGGPSDGQSDAASSTSAWSPVCPALAPAQGSACSDEEIDCEYGCGNVLTCADGTWGGAVLFGEDRSCDAGANPAACPEALSAITPGASCSTAVRCAYAEGKRVVRRRARASAAPARMQISNVFISSAELVTSARTAFGNRATADAAVSRQRESPLFFRRFIIRERIMKTVRWVVAVSCSALSGLAAYACGGSTTGNVDDAGAGADAASDTSAGDSGLTDGPSQDAGACASYVTESCDAGCPLGTVCVREAVVDTEVEHGCYPLPTGCDKASACGCIANCVCPTEFVTACSEQNGGVDCQSGTVSRREFKKDIDYVDDEERASLAAQALRTSLAEYRYKTEPESAKKRLGFITCRTRARPLRAIARTSTTTVTRACFWRRCRSSKNRSTL